MREGIVDGHVVVLTPLRPCEAGARRRQGAEAESFEQACASLVPWIGNHEAARLVELMKKPRAIGHRTRIRPRLGHRQRNADVDCGKSSSAELRLHASPAL